MPRTITVQQALNEALREEMQRDSSVILWGLDVGPYGGAFGVSQGLAEEFGCERVIDMPIAEAGYVGAGVGAAVTGLRPVVELQFSDWVTIASDQLINHAAKMRYMFGGSLSVPMVLRAPVGGYNSGAAQHTQMFESMFAFVPGLKVVLPSTPADAKGLLKAAIRDNNPVIFFEHKQVYAKKGEVPDGDVIVPLGKADVKREGTDVSIITYSYMVHFALQAAEQLAKEGISVEVVDLRTIRPMDKETILNSVKKTNRVVVLQETWPTCSVSSEVSAIIAEHAFWHLDAPVIRVTGKDMPTPMSPKLEKLVLPNVQDVINGVRQAMSTVIR